MTFIGRVTPDKSSFYFASLSGVLSEV